MTAITWFKHYHGASCDPKWPAIADSTGSSPSVVWHTYSWALEYASEREDRGSITGFDVEVVACFCRVKIDEICRIIDAFIRKGMIIHEHIRAWAKRQGEATLAKTAKILSSGARRTANYRKRKVQAACEPELPGLRMNVAQSVTSGVTGVTPRVTSSVTSAVEREEEELRLINQPESPLGFPPSEIVDFAEYREAGKNPHAASSRKRRLPADWRPTHEDREFARAKGYDDIWISDQVERFSDHHISKGSQFCDVSRAWNNWVRNAASFARGFGTERSYGGRQGPPSILRAAARALAAGSPSARWD